MGLAAVCGARATLEEGRGEGRGADALLQDDDLRGLRCVLRGLRCVLRILRRDGLILCLESLGLSGECFLLGRNLCILRSELGLKRLQLSQRIILLRLLLRAPLAVLRLARFDRRSPRAIRIRVYFFFFFSYY